MPQPTQPSSSSTHNNSSEFLSMFGRHTLPVLGDGNCLFCCFSYILYGLEENHLLVRSLIVNFMILNPSLFTAFCHPATVTEHTTRMKQNGQWGTHAEILAFAICFKVPVYTAVQRKNFSSYYWAKFSSSTEDMVIHQADKTISLPLNIKHIEICNINNIHYNVILTSKNSLPSTAPYIGDTSTNHDLPIISLLA